MKTNLIFISIFFSGLLLFAAQERSTTGMKIIVVVDAKSNTISNITPLDTFQKMMVSDVYEQYPGCHFYMGSLIGTYDLTDTEVIPAAHAKVIMYTEREFFRSGDFVDAQTLGKGDNFRIGKVMSIVTSNKKGELCLEIQPS